MIIDLIHFTILTITTLGSVATVIGAEVNAISLHVDQQQLSLTIGNDQKVRFFTRDPLATDVELTLKHSSYFDGTPHKFLLTAAERTADVIVTSNRISSYSVLEIEKCNYINNTSCPFHNVNNTFVSIKVVHSKALSITVIVVGWIYFLAWSISFYPQIILNHRRKSVIGLNFDFLLLNIIGFSCYTLYNVLMYFDVYVQQIYEHKHPHSLIPVLLNDVVFAVHALFACIITAIQCFFYKRGNQRVSYTCLGLSSLFILFSVISLALSVFNVIDVLQFIMCLSYIKMLVTLCKYFPQAFLNYRRKSTIGWSIGNVLLDFIGGSMDILQVILQAVNTDDWSSFSGNPVKFGLGLVSIIFDVLFIAQHYCLYHDKNGPTLQASYEEDSGDEKLPSDEVNVQELPVVIRVAQNES